MISLAAVFVCGCIDNDLFQFHTPEITEPSAEIDGFGIWDINRDVWIYLTSHKEGKVIDSKNIVINQTGNVFYVYAQEIDSNDNERSLVDIKLAKKSELSENEDYIIIVNDKNQSDKSNVFQIKDGNVVTFRIASVDQIEVKESAGELFAVVAVYNFDTIIDRENVTVGNFDENGRCEIIIPEKIVHNNVYYSRESELVELQFSLGSVNQFKDGMYYVESSGMTGNFVVQNGKVITEYDSLEDGAYKVFVGGVEENIIIINGNLIF